MAAAVTLTIRRSVIDGYQAGESKRAIARRLKLAYGTVHTLCQRFAAQAEAGLLPRYERCGKQLPRRQLLYRAACMLKRRHAAWGAPLIRLKLLARYATRSDLPKVPSARTIQRWWREAGLQVPRSVVPKPEKQWAEQCHDIWQVDAKEKQRTADGQDCCWLTTTDEHSTAILAAPSFPPGEDHSGSTATGAAGSHRRLSTLGAATGHQG